MKKLLNTIYVTNPDSYLSLDGENLVVMREEKKVRMPLHNVERIMTFGYTGASPALMGKCAKDGRELVFMTSSGKFLARVEGAVSGNVLLRRQQYRVADDADASLSITRNMIVGKLFNSRWVLERMIRDHAPRIDTETFRQKSQFLQRSISKAAEADSADTLRGIEGEAALVYFSVSKGKGSVCISRQKQAAFAGSGQCNAEFCLFADDGNVFCGAGVRGAGSLCGRTAHRPSGSTVSFFGSGRGISCALL